MTWVLVWYIIANGNEVILKSPPFQTADVCMEARSEGQKYLGDDRWRLICLPSGSPELK